MKVKTITEYRKKIFVPASKWFHTYRLAQTYSVVRSHNQLLHIQQLCSMTFKASTISHIQFFYWVSVNFVIRTNEKLQKFKNSKIFLMSEWEIFQCMGVRVCVCVNHILLNMTILARRCFHSHVDTCFMDLLLSLEWMHFIMIDLIAFLIGHNNKWNDFNRNGCSLGE